MRFGLKTIPQRIENAIERGEDPAFLGRGGGLKGEKTPEGFIKFEGDGFSAVFASANNELLKWRAQSKLQQVKTQLEQKFEILRIYHLYNTIIKKKYDFSDKYLNKLYNLLNKDNISNYPQKRKRILDPLKKKKNKKNMGTFREYSLKKGEGDFYVTAQRAGDLSEKELKKQLQPIKKRDNNFFNQQFPNTFYAQTANFPFSNSLKKIKDSSGVFDNESQKGENIFDEKNEMFDDQGKFHLKDHRLFRKNMRTQYNFYQPKEKVIKDLKLHTVEGFINKIENIRHKFSKEIPIQRPSFNPCQKRFFRVLNMRKFREEQEKNKTDDDEKELLSDRSNKYRNTSLGFRSTGIKNKYKKKMNFTLNKTK